MDISYIREIAELDSTSECSIFKVEDCKLPYSPEYWYRRSAKELNAPFYMESASNIVVKIIGSDKKAVKEIEMKADKGLNFMSWDLMLNENEMAEPGTYQLQIKCDKFKTEKMFEVKKYERRR